jgi:glycosyltransferase involved in cell wall biosynthesis
MKAKVCHISTAHTPLDTRIFYKEGRSLAQEGYEVYYIVSHDKEEVVEGVHMIPLPEENSRSYRFLKKRKIALQKAIELDADLYHFHDPELIPVGRKLKSLGKKVIYDVHEDVPKQILSKEWLKTDFIRKTVSKSFNLYEKSSIKSFDRIIAARPDIAESFPAEKTTVVVNSPVITIIDQIPPADIKVERPIIIYAGAITRIRGIKELIEAMGILKGKAELWIFGKWDDKSFEAECSSLEGWKYVVNKGFVPQDDVYAYMKKAAMGVVNFWPEPNHLLTLPNKPFEYMACYLPMVMSDFKYWQKMFANCFLGADPKSPEDIADKINYLLDNPEKAKELGENGRQLVMSKYSWEAEKLQLFKAYSDVLANDK